MLKKIVGLLGCVAITLTFTGCPKEESSTTPTTDNAADAAADAADDAADAADDAKKDGEAAADEAKKDGE